MPEIFISSFNSTIIIQIAIDSSSIHTSYFISQVQLYTTDEAHYKKTQYAQKPIQAPPANSPTKSPWTNSTSRKTAFERNKDWLTAFPTVNMFSPDTKALGSVHLSFYINPIDKRTFAMSAIKSYISLILSVSNQQYTDSVHL